MPPDKRSLLVNELLSLSPSHRSHMLLTVPLCLAEKRALRYVRSHWPHRAPTARAVPGPTPPLTPFSAGQAGAEWAGEPPKAL